MIIYRSAKPLSCKKHRNALFSLITEGKVTIEPKFMGAYNAANYLNITLTSNAKHIIMAGENARRFFVPTVSEHRVTDFAYFAAIDEQLRNGGYEALLYHFLHIDLSDFNVRAVPKTAGLAEQAAYTRGGVEGLVEEVCNTGQVPCAHFKWAGFTVTGGVGEEFVFKTWLGKSKDKELRERLSPLMVVNRLRKEWGCVAERRREGSSSKADIRISGLLWPTLAELRQKFVERFGPQDWQHSDVLEWEVEKEEPSKDEPPKKDEPSKDEPPKKTEKGKANPRKIKIR